ncbi:MAG: hypothetical protein IJC40_04890 [Muribaculaceae bacterium]|nr:hypothetical protein [Muribaculaceae bacterium]
MKTIIKSIALSICLAGAISAVAQNTNSGYFTENYTYRYQLNPAMANADNFIAMPGVGNLNAAMRGTVGIDNILYNINGETTTFLNPLVDAGEFLNGLNDVNRIGADIKIGLLSAGFKAFNGYNTVSLNVRGNMNTRLPKTLFSFLKEGISNQTYDISDVKAHVDAYIELGLGHSHQLGEKWRVGGALKFLLGGANIDADFDKAQLTLGTDAWTAVTNARLQSSVKGLTYKHDVNDRTGHEYVSGMDVDGFGLNGFGMAVDLGAVFTPTSDWTFSAAVLDFGFISWGNNMVASTNGDKTFTTDKYTFNVDDEAENSFENEWDIMRDDISALYELEDNGDMGSRTTMLGATLNLGIEYTLPAYRNLKFGLLNSTRIQGNYSWTEFRLSANVAPCKVFSAGANMALGTYGFSFGWLMNVKVTGFNMFLGMDHTLGKLAKQGLPLSSNASVNLGINFPF